ncbi:MAG: hypothetical protein H6741_17390 [Alphaproteobacteria bacterium]|nr:hypothetical protein [Alphaproteobacteria bacterium]MCB9794492.1 hypothetical protein [Alphaproteobacteria bacterium]
MLVLRRPRVTDVDSMLHLMEPHVRSGALLPRNRRQVLERLRDFSIAEERGKVVGLMSLTVVGEDLAELGALVWAREEQLRTLVTAALDEARSLGVERVVALVSDPGALGALGFREVAVETVPEKYERQCLRCPRAPRCRQVALVANLAELASQAA